MLPIGEVIRLKVSRDAIFLQSGFELPELFERIAEAVVRVGIAWVVSDRFEHFHAGALPVLIKEKGDPQLAVERGSAESRLSETLRMFPWKKEPQTSKYAKSALVS